MKAKIFLSLLAAGSFCVVASAQAQQTEAGAQRATKQTAGKAQQVPATSNNAAAKTGNAVPKASGPQQKVDVVIGSTGLSPATSTVSAGSVALEIVNASEKPHKMVLEGGTMKKIVADVNVGGRARMDGLFVPGTYTLSCQASGHVESRAKLTVK